MARGVRARGEQGAGQGIREEIWGGGEWRKEGERNLERAFPLRCILLNIFHMGRWGLLQGGVALPPRACHSLAHLLTGGWCRCLRCTSATRMSCAC